jgi:hypothetical protein
MVVRAELNQLTIEDLGFHVSGAVAWGIAHGAWLALGWAPRNQWSAVLEAARETARDEAGRTAAAFLGSAYIEKTRAAVDAAWLAFEDDCEAIPLSTRERRFWLAYWQHWGRPGALVGA